MLKTSLLLTSNTLANAQTTNFTFSKNIDKKLCIHGKWLKKYTSSHFGHFKLTKKWTKTSCLIFWPSDCSRRIRLPRFVDEAIDIHLNMQANLCDLWVHSGLIIDFTIPPNFQCKKQKLPTRDAHRVRETGRDSILRRLPAIKRSVLDNSMFFCSLTKKKQRFFQTSHSWLFF